MGSIPRADVSKELSGLKLITMINDTNWKKRKEAFEKMNQVLEKANMRISPNGLSEVVGLLKVRMSDSNKMVSRGFIEFVGNFALALGSSAKVYAQMLVKPLLRCLTDKNTLVRQFNLEAINKWSSAIGPENMITNISSVIIKDNPEIRSVLLDWVLLNKDSIPKSETDKLPKGLIACIQDKSPAIRSKAEAIIMLTIPYTGASSFRKEVADLKLAIQNTIKPIIDK